MQYYHYTALFLFKFIRQFHPNLFNSLGTKIHTQVKKNKSNRPSGFEKFSTQATHASGSTIAFLIAFLVIVVWLITGPLFNYSNTWQLFINTGTTIVTFLMVFLIQRSQNKDSIAVHLKLNELIVAQKMASNRLLAIEEISEDDLKVLQKFYKQLAELAEQELPVEQSHSLHKVNEHHRRKKQKE